MRSSKSRSRNKSNRQRTLGNVVNRVFDSSGPEGKVRGTPQQIIEKYLTLARDAQLSGDRVAEQAFFQHAEHYTRMLGEAQKEMAERQQFHQPRQDGEDGQGVQANGNNGQPQSRDYQGGREEYRREEYRRDDNRRDDARREEGRRDQGSREENRRDDNRRDQGGRDTQRDHSVRDQGARDQMPLSQSRPDPEFTVPSPDPAPQDMPSVSAADSVSGTEQPGLPEAVVTPGEDATGLVDTPEAQPRPGRTRAPRAPRADRTADNAAPRPRRRKAAQDAPIGEDTATASDD